jgi:hypothetical protein
MKISAATQRPAPSRQFTGSKAIIEHVCEAIRDSAAVTKPWPHRRIACLLPSEVLCALAALPLSPALAEEPSGRREYRNASRIYFDQPNMVRFPVMRDVAEAMQSQEVAGTVGETFAAPIDGTFLRIEYALDTDGFWLEPHTDIGVKKFTCFLYLDGAGDLGTDIYSRPRTFDHRVPFVPNSALAFVPDDSTWLGFAPRRIPGVRRSLIINYVGPDWRSREQLSFPEAAVRLVR